MEFSKETPSFSKYGKTFQEKLCMVILDDRAFADQIEEVLDISFLELNYLKLFLNKVFNFAKDTLVKFYITFSYTVREYS